MNVTKEMLRLYAITDRRWTGRQNLYEQIEDALKGGVTMVQLREKHLPEDALMREAVKVKELCRRYQVPLIINDNVNAALQSGADGVHVGIQDAPVPEIRRNVPENFIIGATCKTVEQARAAQRDGADYIGAGAVFPSPHKEKCPPDYCRTAERNLFVCFYSRSCHRRYRPGQSVLPERHRYQRDCCGIRGFCRGRYPGSSSRAEGRSG